jgi:glutamate-ammonia-ligase adenylyltransferase
MESLIRELPDPEAARLFFERISAEHPREARRLARDAGLMADTLALAAWSPLLSTTLTQHPEYLQWLARERVQAVGLHTREELGESLARFHLTHSQAPAQVVLARFRRRELLRIYLRDIRRTATLVEVTEELSNLADAVLEHALSLARQELDNRYGAPQRTDERGRVATATFSIIALGKLGSHELNYASDIDLVFLYSDEGVTDGKGERGSATNREYFVKLAETVARLVGQQAGEGAAYRVDLRLRPYGGVGTLASSLDEAVRYYREEAHAWELQTLIRSRSAAGDPTLYARFADAVRHRVYRPEETLQRALSHVRLAKQKIDRQHALATGGFNVKLGRGGIREIEFIAQALQLSHGGRDEWLRASHTLISLGRLAERRLITERERAELFDAYHFLRTLEHRLQMEQGLQTHSVPEDLARRRLVARRMGFDDTEALDEFNDALSRHTANVCAAYDRVFDGIEEEEMRQAAGRPVPVQEMPEEEPRRSSAPAAARDAARRAIEEPVEVLDRAVDSAASAFALRLRTGEDDQEEVTVEKIAARLRRVADESLNPKRALILAARVASSLDKSVADASLSFESLDALVRFCGASEMFGEMLASNPSLIASLPVQSAQVVRRDYRARLTEAVTGEESFGAELAALRRAWAASMIEIGALDAGCEINMREANRLQTRLAEASLDAGCLIAARELQRRYGESNSPARLAVLGLGRLGGGGVDYGSDLDVILIYDSLVPSPVSQLNHMEAYARFAELLVAALSSMTREGFLYRVDLRLRPDGKNGATCSGTESFSEYLKTRAVPWEWLAYVKLRAAAGDMELGKKVETETRCIIHEATRDAGDDQLRIETRRVRERLEGERTKKGRAGTDIKYGAGGMLDVYFATRYLQLRDRVPDAGDDRSTQATIRRLHDAGSLLDDDYTMMSQGYSHLRALDHHIRLIVGRSTRLPARDHPALPDIATRMGYGDRDQLVIATSTHMKKIREAYNRITVAEGKAKN